MNTLTATRQAIKSRIVADTVLSQARDVQIAMHGSNDIADLLYESADLADTAAHTMHSKAMYTVDETHWARLDAIIDRQVYARRKQLFPQQYI